MKYTIVLLASAIAFAMTACASAPQPTPEPTIITAAKPQPPGNAKTANRGDHTRVGNVGAPVDKPPVFNGDFDAAGYWSSTWDDSVLELSKDKYYHRFQYNNGVRENYGEILSIDPAKGHIRLRYTKVLQDGQPVDDYFQGVLYMKYRIESDGKLTKYIGENGFPKRTGQEEYVRDNGI